MLADDAPKKMNPSLLQRYDLPVRQFTSAAVFVLLCMFIMIAVLLFDAAQEYYYQWRSFLRDQHFPTADGAT